MRFELSVVSVMKMEDALKQDEIQMLKLTYISSLVNESFHELISDRQKKSVADSAALNPAC